MHELSIATSIVDILCQTARRENLRAISRVTLRIGALRQVAPRAMRIAFDAAKENTVAADADVCMHFTPVRCRCRECGAECELTELIFVCPRCQSPRLRTLSGDELLVESIDGER
jgi:hydrogenase nickel incorporation protein HypA/HybF